MANIHEEVITIKLSKLVKNSETLVPQIANSEIVTSIEQIVQELVGNDIIVETETETE
jgi:hypothetical protein